MKQVTFLVDHEGNIADAAMITGGIETTLAYIRTYLENMEEGAVENFEITRRDMTKEELDAAPVI